LTENNPREVIGDNRPPLAAQISSEEGDFAAVTTAYLEDAYRNQPIFVENLLQEYADVPRSINSPEEKATVAGLIKRMRDTAKAIEAFHAKEKQPYLRGGQAVDQYFFRLIDKLARRAKANKPGAADTLLARLTDYDNRVLMEEMARRKREAEEAARAARVAAEEAERAAKEAEERRLAAERARKPEIAEQKAEAAREAEDTADHAAARLAAETTRAQDARISTFARPADVMRTRGPDGTLSTVAQETFAEIMDRNQLPKDILWPFIPLDALQKALNSFAKSTDYRQTILGANIGRRNKSVVR
jgi:hypothetical protein